MRWLLLVLFTPLIASAGQFDIDLSRFTRSFCNGAEISRTASCSGTLIIQPDNQKFYSLASELGVAMAAPLLSPSETLGFGGFSVGTHFGFTTISKSEDYWWAAESYEFAQNDPLQHSDNISAGFVGSAGPPPGVASTIGAMVRKGLIPGFELGVGFSHLLQSSLFAVQADAKLSLHEGFHTLPIPEVSVRGSASRVMGQTAFDLTTAGVDFSVSKQLGIQGTVNLTPLAGYQLLWIIADPEVMDGTPQIDPVAESAGDTGRPVCQHDDCNANYVFFDPDPIVRHRVFFGFRLNFDPVTFATQATFSLKGSSEERYFDSVTGDLITATDESAMQQSYHAMVGLDF